jgi:cysteine sulfinate desulfinase/cysteine desulfurase-like protein
VIGAAGAAIALAAVDSLGQEGGRWEIARRMSDELAHRLIEKQDRTISVNAFPSKQTTVSGSTRLCNTVHLSFLHRGGREVVEALDRRFGIAASTGSACARSEPSLALAAAGFSEAEVRGAVRISSSPVFFSGFDVGRVTDALVATLTDESNIK